ncbi:MAG TPA: DsbA family protein [Candidatus Paceibacterota bacterium]|jgi:protein-disulfide isomerase|nr:DsbA family protein [Candidatus Paceibacterota bacterium]
MEPQENQEQPVEIQQQETQIKSKAPLTIAAAIVTGAAMIALALIIALHPSGSTSATGNTAGSAPTTPTSIPASVTTLRASDMAHIRGDANAQILIFEYSDSDCPFCQQFHPVLQQVVKDYKGKVAWVYRYFPLDIHPDSHNEAEALDCVGQLGGAKAFNGFLDAIMNVTLSPTKDTFNTLATFASEQGVDKNAFNTCVANPATSATIDASIKESESIGAQGTPFSIIVNTKTGKQIIIPGSYPLDAVEKDIDSLLK